MARGKYVRNHEKVDEAIKGSLLKLREQFGSEFKASVNSILDNVDKRRISPSRPSVENSLERLQAEGFVTVTSEGRAAKTFSFPNGKAEAQIAEQKKPRGRPKVKAEATGEVQNILGEEAETSEPGENLQNLASQFKAVVEANKNLRMQIHDKLNKMLAENKALEEIVTELAGVEV